VFCTRPPRCFCAARPLQSCRWSCRLHCVLQSFLQCVRACARPGVPARRVRRRIASGSAGTAAGVYRHTYMQQETLAGVQTLAEMGVCRCHKVSCVGVTKSHVLYCMVLGVYSHTLRIYMHQAAVAGGQTVVETNVREVSESLMYSTARYFVDIFTPYTYICSRRRWGESRPFWRWV